MKAYSTDLRERIVKAIQTGSSRKAVADRYQVSIPTVDRYLRLIRENGCLVNKNSNKTKKRLVSNKHLLKELINQNPTASIKLLCKAWQERVGTLPSISTMWRAIKQLKSQQ